MPDRVVEVLASLVKHPHFDRWVYMTQTDTIRTILTNALETHFTQSKEFVSHLISHLSAVGDGSYLNLLPA